MAIDTDSSLKKSSTKNDSRQSAAVGVANFSLESLSKLDGLQVHDVVMQGIPISVAKEVICSFDFITAAEIRTVLGVSAKTLQRDVGTILDANASDRALRLLGARQGSCRLCHAASGCIPSARCAIASAVSRSGLSVTAPMGVQSRVSRDQRAGLRSRACA